MQGYYVEMSIMIYFIPYHSNKSSI